MTWDTFDTRPHRFVITCMEPGCTNHIHYTDEDIEVPLYCHRHATEDGRHSAVRKLK
jgi:hypothetical protein